MAWVVPAADKGEIKIVDLGAAEEIDKAVEVARQAIQQSAAKIKKADDEPTAEQPALEALTKLAALILDPLKPHLGEAKQLILSPDSNLWLVPWAALPVEEGKYAIENWQIRYVTSGRDLVAEQLAANAPKAPAVKAPDLCRPQLRSRWQEHPGGHPGGATRPGNSACPAGSGRPFRERAAESRSAARHRHRGPVDHSGTQDLRPRSANALQPAICRSKECSSWWLRPRCWC